MDNPEPTKSPEKPYLSVCDDLYDIGEQSCGFAALELATFVLFALSYIRLIGTHSGIFNGWLTEMTESSTGDTSICPSSG
jgi:hypothetical protein